MNDEIMLMAAQGKVLRCKVDDIREIGAQYPRSPPTGYGWQLKIAWSPWRDWSNVKKGCPTRVNNALCRQHGFRSALPIMAMNHSTSPPAGATAGTRTKRPLDTVVKMALGVLFGSFALIWGGMFLSRPDRSIPPYSIGSQERTLVAVHVPSWTSDTEIETLIGRFRKSAVKAGILAP